MANIVNSVYIDNTLYGIDVLYAPSATYGTCAAMRFCTTPSQMRYIYEDNGKYYVDLTNVDIYESNKVVTAVPTKNCEITYVNHYYTNNYEEPPVDYTDNAVHILPTLTTAVSDLYMANADDTYINATVVGDGDTLPYNSQDINIIAAATVGQTGTTAKDGTYSHLYAIKAKFGNKNLYNTIAQSATYYNSFDYSLNTNTCYTFCSTGTSVTAQSQLTNAKRAYGFLFDYDAPLFLNTKVRYSYDASSPDTLVTGDYNGAVTNRFNIAFTEMLRTMFMYGIDSVNNAFNTTKAAYAETFNDAVIGNTVLQADANDSYTETNTYNLQYYYIANSKFGSIKLANGYIPVYTDVPCIAAYTIHEATKNYIKSVDAVNAYCSYTTYQTTKRTSYGIYIDEIAKYSTIYDSTYAGAVTTLDPLRLSPIAAHGFELTLGLLANTVAITGAAASTFCTNVKQYLNLDSRVIKTSIVTALHGSVNDHTFNIPYTANNVTLANAVIPAVSVYSNKFGDVLSNIQYSVIDVDSKYTGVLPLWINIPQVRIELDDVSTDGTILQFPAKTITRFCTFNSKKFATLLNNHNSKYKTLGKLMYTFGYGTNASTATYGGWSSANISSDNAVIVLASDSADGIYTIRISLPSSTVTVPDSAASTTKRFTRICLALNL